MNSFPADYIMLSDPAGKRIPVPFWKYRNFQRLERQLTTVVMIIEVLRII